MIELAQAVYAARSLLAAADDVRAELREVGAHGLDQVSAVVDYYIRPVGENVPYVAEVLLLAHTVFGVNLDTARSQGRSHVVLSGERVGAGDIHLGASGGQYAAEVRRLGLQMHAEGYFQACEGLFALKIGLNAAQHGHIALNPGYFLLAGRGECYVLDLIHRSYPPKILSHLDVQLSYSTTTRRVVQPKSA